MNIIRDKERVNQTGEVFTPTPLVNEILDKLPLDVFTDPSKTFCDPACGDGQFLVEVLKRKLENGQDATVAMKTIYGVDLMPDNITFCKTRLRDVIKEYITIGSPESELGGTVKGWISKNIVCSDAFDWDFDNWTKTVAAVEKAERIAKEMEQKEFLDDALESEEHW